MAGQAGPAQADGDEETRRRRRRGGAGLALAAGVVLVLGIGELRGESEARRVGPLIGSPPVWEESFQCSAAMPSAEPAKVTTRLSFTATGEPVEVAHRVTVTVPTDWPEVTALRAPDVADEVRTAARRCLLGDETLYGRWPSRPLTFRVSGPHTQITVEDPHVFLFRETPSCWGPLTAYLEDRALRAGIGHVICDEGTVMTDPDTEHVARIVTPDRDRVRLSPAPDREGYTSFQWTWTGTGAPDLAVEVPLDFGSYAATSMTNGASLDLDPLGDDLILRLGGLGSWTPTFVVLLLTAAALAYAGAISSWAALIAALATLLLTAGATLSWQPPGFASGFASAVVPLVAVGGTAVAAALLGGGHLRDARRWGAVAIGSAVVGAALVSVAVAEVHRSPAEDDARGEALATVVIVGALVLVAVLLWRLLVWLLSTLRREAPEDREFPWRIARWAVGVSVVGAFVFGIGWYVGFSRRSSGPIDLLSWTTTSWPLYPLAYAGAAVAGLGFIALLRVWSDRGADALVRNLVALGLLWALVAAPAHLYVWGLTVPVGALLLAAALPLAVRRSGDVRRMAIDGVDEADLEDRETVRKLFVHGPVGTWQGNLAVTVELGAFLAIVPVAYFLWALLQSVPERSTDPLNVTFLVGSAVFESARWISTAAVFGLLYPRLWGHVGPLKALSLSAVWFGAAAAGEVAARWSGHGTERGWSFPGFQLLLFTGVLAVGYDLRTLQRLGLGWRQLQTAYGLERTRDLVAVTVPLALAVIAIAQQLATGSGLDFVESILNGIPNAVRPPPS